MLDAARSHRLHLLLAASLAPGECQAAEAVALSHALKVEAALDAWRDQEASDLLDALRAAGARALLIKGAALAHTLYPQPHLRPRADIDLLIPGDSRERVERVLEARGWSHPIETEAELATAQRHYVKPAPGGGVAHVDLHWKIVNPHVFADAVSFDELERRAMPVPALGSSAHAPGSIDALLLACIHRVAHHHDAIDLLWLWDIHLLTGRLSADEKTQFVALARRTRMITVCRRGLELASNLFASSGAAAILRELESNQEASDEPSARFLGGIPTVAVLREDLLALPTWRARSRLVIEHLFPSAGYMRMLYPRWPPVLLPLAYADRIARGAPKWFRRS